VAVYSARLLEKLSTPCHERQVCLVLALVRILLVCSSSLALMAHSTLGFAGEDPLVVSFYLSVFDKNGKPVENLNQKDFQALEDKVPQTITGLKFEKNTPVSLGILIDISRGMGAGGTNETLSWVKALAQRMRSPDEFFVNAFSDESQEVVDFISPEDYLDDPIDKLGVGGQSRMGLAVDIGLIKLRDARNPKRGLLVISPGRDIAGKATLEHIAKSRLPVYGLGISGTAGFGGIMDRVKSLNVKGSALVVYAGQSGGDVTFVDSPETGDRWLEKFYIELRNQYLIEYRSTNPKRDGKLRKIEVRVSDPTCSLRYLHKYLAPYTPSSHLRY
jgi:VWFA-related protein